MKRDNFFARRWAIAVELAVGFAITLILCRIGWMILATSIADHSWRSDPKSALAWSPTNSTALLSIGETIFVRATRPRSEGRSESILFRPPKEGEFRLDRDGAEHMTLGLNILLKRVGRPTIGDVDSVARWIDLQFSRSHYARAVERMTREELQKEQNWFLPLLADGRRGSPVAVRHVEDHPNLDLLESELRAARTLAQMSLVSNPLQQRAFVLLSDIAARLGESDRSDSLLNVASNRSFRNAVSHTRSIERQISRSDYSSAIAGADAMLRLGGTIRHLLGQLLTNAAMDARSYPALSEFLVREPSWRPSVFERLGEYDDADSGVRVLSKLAGGGHALHATDIAPVLRQLMKQGRTMEAYLAWTQFLSEAKRAKAKLVFDGGFTEHPSNIPFEWNVTEFPRGSVNFLRLPDPENKRAIRIEFVGAGGPKLSVYQVLSLSPGRYRLKIEASADSLRAARGVVWRLSCLQKRENVLAETEPLRGSTPWRELSVDFEMPADVCDFPVLRLALSAKSAPELIANGTVYFRNLRLIRRPARIADSAAAGGQNDVGLMEGSRLRAIDASEGGN